MFKEFKLRDLISIKNGKNYTDLSDYGKTPVYGTGGLMGYTSSEGLYKGEAILLPRKGSLTNIMYVNQDFWTVDTMYYAPIKSPLADAYYLYNYLNLLDLSGLDSGSGVPSMTFNAYYDLKVSLPDIETQQIISKVIRLINDKIALNNKINAELEQTARLIYDYWFTQFDFPDAQGKPYKSSGGAMVYNDQLKREIPQGWGDGTIDKIGTVVGGSTPPTKEANNFTNDGIPWITPNDLSRNEGNKFISTGAQSLTEKGVKVASLKIYPAGTVLLSSRAPVGYMAIARNPVTTNQGFKSFIPNMGYSTEYTFYAVKSSLNAIIQYASGSTFKEISGATLKTVKVVVPPVSIANKYSEIVLGLFKQQDICEQENQELAKLRDWLLPMLMTGQVKVVSDA